MRYVAAGLFLLVLSACPGTTVTKGGSYTIGGAVNGLTDGSLLLSNNGADPLTVRQSGRFTFATSMKQGDRYEVRIVTQPSTLNCTVSSGSGVVGTTNVSNVVVNCVTKTTGNLVGGTLSGLNPGNGNIVLQQGTEQLSLGSNGNFNFVNRVAKDAAYTVTVATAPANYICAVANASGVMGSTDVTNVQVSCTQPTYSVSGTVFNANGPVTVSNGNVDYVVEVNSPNFEFDGLKLGDTYTVTVTSQPAEQDCTVTNGTGPVGNANITGVTVTCRVKTYSVSGSVANNGGNLVITNTPSSGSPVNITVAGPQISAFSFDGLPDGADYSISITTTPPAESCQFSGTSVPTGTINHANVSLSISCQTVTQYNLSGTVSGATGDVKLTNQGDPTIYTVHPSDGTFTIKANEASDYNVMVSQAPVGQVCTVTNGSGSNLIGDVSNIQVTCATLSVIGSVTGNTNITVSNPNSLILSVSKNGTITRVAIPAAAADVNFAFPGYTPGDTWNIDVYNNPAGLTCAKTSGNGGAVGNSNVTGVVITCTPATYNLIVDVVWATKTAVEGLWGGNTCSSPNSCPNPSSCSSTAVCSPVTINWTSDSGSGPGSATFNCPADQSYLGIPGAIGPLKDGETVQLSVDTQPSGQTCVFAPSDTFTITRGMMAGARLICVMPCYPAENGC